MTLEAQNNRMPADNQPLVSIVTPVYNNAEHLAECIESVLAQTYSNWEYTIINNRSTDGSGEVAESYARKYSRIKVVHNEEFLRAIANHNRALREVSLSSKYVKMVFADDLVLPTCLEEMVSLAEKFPSIGIVGAYGIEGDRVRWTGLRFPVQFVLGRDICRMSFLQPMYVFGTASSLLFRADLVRQYDPFYDEGNIHADTETCFSLLKVCDFGFVHQVLTYTRERRESLTTYSKEINTYLAGWLTALIRHGRGHLTEGEYSFCINRCLTDYYAFLGDALIRRRNRKFWEFHRNKLESLGVGFSRCRITLAAVTKVGRLLLNPERTLERLIKGPSPTA